MADENILVDLGENLTPAVSNPFSANPDSAPVFSSAPTGGTNPFIAPMADPLPPSAFSPPNASVSLIHRLRRVGECKYNLSGKQRNGGKPNYHPIKSIKMISPFCSLLGQISKRWPHAPKAAANASGADSA